MAPYLRVGVYHLDSMASGPVLTLNLSLPFSVLSQKGGELDHAQDGTIHAGNAQELGMVVRAERLLFVVDFMSAIHIIDCVITTVWSPFQYLIDQSNTNQ